MSRPPFDFDISVSADKQRRARRRGLSGAVEGADRACDHPNCTAKAAYRAPRSPDDLEQFYWFCLEHVREYNRRWNFFADLNDTQMEQQIEADRLWGRPTWSFRGSPDGDPRAASHIDGAAWRRMGFEDPIEILGEKATRGGDPRSAAPARRRLPQTERRALEILGAEDAATKTEIRALYKELVKQLHPDMNGGHRDDEDRLQEVLWAWEQIKGSRSFRE
ncbi:MAG: DnaJ domain-containing protein [Pseudomonadota bacterium]